MNHLLVTALTAFVEPTASSSPDVTPPGLKDTSETTTEWLAAWWDWFVGIPLRIVLIVLIGTVALALLRRVIGSVADHIAEGEAFGLKDTGEGGTARGGADVRTVLLKASPLATARRAQRARTIGSVLRSTASILVGSITVLLVLDTLGVNLAPFIASAGIVGVAVGFGAQSLVKDVLSGMFMLMEDQYGVGDVVDVGPATGTVEAVGLRVTRLRDGDGTLWYVPNGSMLRVGNKTQGFGTAVVELDVDYFADLDRVRDLLEIAAAQVAADDSLGAVLEGAPTITTAENLTAEAVRVRLKVRTVAGEHWRVARALRVAVRQVLEEADVPLAGQRDALEAHRARATGADADATTAVVSPAAPGDGTGDEAAPGDAGAEDDAQVDGTGAAAGTRDPRDTPVHGAVEPPPAR
ncbi:mechanosensitive ion channel family protein [Cellulomonas oligotrophica]|uniref:Small conductance mechanosensitive channel n=1 Tax=Cellulomonas oligotrophica TaxID=931536 RepID=A0A7Y9FIP1_9CELL|nr:mechanosensitive ion channel family protein [Cellulomonas oligotrophica]NYD87959.1 small conductance mechanosensitive channel [Cellulomonas oligotrophica]GIG32833.1 hypothetical protein Col01nite_19920 [Cellulomonas oligotrophica]